MPLLETLAHVRYVTAPDEGADLGTVQFLREAFLSPTTALFLGAAALMLLAYIAIMPRLRGWGAFRATLAATLFDYHRYVPWVLRLSAGIALMGSGLAGYLFAAHLETPSHEPIAVVLVACGFALLVGVAVRVFAIVALAVYSFALVSLGPDVFMTAEVAAALIAVAILGAGRPSLDDLLARTLSAAPRSVHRPRRGVPLCGHRGEGPRPGASHGDGGTLRPGVRPPHVAALGRAHCAP
jgi:hypothetical protein